LQFALVHSSTGTVIWRGSRSHQLYP
jgi:hypothetical protein